MILQKVTDLLKKNHVIRLRSRCSRGWDLFFLLPLQLSQSLDGKEYTECDDQEVDSLLNKIAIVEGHGRLHHLRAVHHSLVQDDFKICEIKAADEHTDARHDDVVDQ